MSRCANKNFGKPEVVGPERMAVILAMADMVEAAREKATSLSKLKIDVLAR